MIKDILEKEGDCINYSSSGRGNGIVESRINNAIKSLTITRAGYNNRAMTCISVYSLPHGFYKGGTFNREKMPTLRKDSINNYFLINGEKFRKLTVIELERLQTLPDNYTLGISNNQRCKCIGNGWTIKVIEHIFKGLPK